MLIVVPYITWIIYFGLSTHVDVSDTCINFGHSDPMIVIIFSYLQKKKIKFARKAIFLVFFTWT